MTPTQEAAMRQALEALDAYSWEQVDAARTALRAALAEPVQEPVAWMYDCGNGGRMYAEELDGVEGWAPLYTASPQRKPLTEEEIYSLFRTVASPVMFARAVEKAHGIGEQP